MIDVLDIPDVSVTIIFPGYFVPFFRLKDEVRNLNPSALSLKRKTVPENTWVEKPVVMSNVLDIG
jgi:hypothetical protein